MCPRSQQRAQHLGSCARPLTSLLFKCEGSRPCGSPRNPNRRRLRPPTKHRPSQGGAGRAEFLPERSTSRSRGLAFAAFAAVSDRFFFLTDSAGRPRRRPRWRQPPCGRETDRRKNTCSGDRRPRRPFGQGAWTGCCGERWCLPGWPFRVLRALHLRPAWQPLGQIG